MIRQNRMANEGRASRPSGTGQCLTGGTPVLHLPSSQKHFNLSESRP
jgi:hypothetical protein